jgi:dTDP-4-amino-4,6-dideoxygalactose transaminase
MSFESINEFENKVAHFFGSKYAVAIDSCTHGLEICLRMNKVRYFTCPKGTYISVPFLAEKLNISFAWREEDWEEYYFLGETNIIDAAVLWRQDSYVPDTLMCVSFQYRKHLSLGRGGIILTDDRDVALLLKKMSYDGRLPNIPWREQNIDTMGYHYYMTPETAELGLKKLENAINTEPKKWVTTDWPDLSKMKIFQNKQIQGIDPYLQTR